MGSDDQPTDEIDASGPRAGATVAEPPLIAPQSTIGGRYRLERRLGYGGMATVWLATDERLGRPVAIKVISDTLAGDGEYLDRFRREARVAAGLGHPNLVSVYDFGAGDRPYLVMEYVPGGDLSERIAAGDPPQPERLAAELLSALCHIHEAHVLHRDIKPQNVLLDEDGSARLTDFGIAQPRDATSLTHTGKVLGTESYIAPEVMRGEPASERSDLYALGVVLSDVARDGASPAFWALADRLRDPEPDARPRSAAEALDELEHGGRPPTGSATQPYAIEPESEPVVAEPLPAAPPRASNRRRLMAGLAAVAVAAAVGVGLALASGGDSGGGSGETAPSGQQASSGGKGSGKRQSNDEGGRSAAPAAAQDATEEPAPDEEPAGGEDGAALNDQGFELVRDGRHEEAIPILERARDALAGSGDTATYNYALFNLASAYMGAGRPADAIPLLEERMKWDDGQIGQVQAALDEAYAASGQEAPSPEGGNGPAQGGGPPPWANDDD